MILMYNEQTHLVRVAQVFMSLIILIKLLRHDYKTAMLMTQFLVFLFLTHLFCVCVCNVILLPFLIDVDVVVSPTGHTGRLLKSLCFTSMTFLLFHIIYQITVNSLLAKESIRPEFNCESNAFYKQTKISCIKKSIRYRTGLSSLFPDLK